MADSGVKGATKSMVLAVRSAEGSQSAGGIVRWKKPVCRFTEKEMGVPFSSKQPHQWTGEKVRKAFLDFFARKGHKIVPSSSVVPYEDPTLLFTNAGMNQFKGNFLGTVDASSEFGKLKRACDSQKCIRAGGKHNDLEDVGKDGYHHTFFEMLGNWSFGDYFKKEAIEWSWELLVNVFKLDPARLYVTYFEGDEASGVPADLEAKALWMKVGIPEDHIIPGNIKDNFWEMGETGPCGPCSEIHYDRIGGRNAAHLVNMDDPNVLEIWNNVFMQFDRQADRSLKPLPAQHIDTGMGFERLVSILQDKVSNYDTDIFYPLFDCLQEVTSFRKYTDKYGKDDVDGVDTAYRVLADHVRLVSFAIADGGTPSNVGRGYVVRRVIRRALRYARTYFHVPLGKNSGSFFAQLVPALVQQMGGQFKELADKQNLIIETVKSEEDSFATALVNGEKKFEGYHSYALAHPEQDGTIKISGANVWNLYESFGFPVDLTQIIADEKGIKIDPAEVEAARLKAVEASKSIKKEGFSFPKLDVHRIAELGKIGIVKTNDSPKFTEDTITSTVLLIFDGQNLLKTTKGLSLDKPISIVLNKTNFYAEQGGQIFDTGSLYDNNGAEFRVADVQSYGGFVLHNGYMQSGVLSAGGEVTSQYESTRRQLIAMNHTGTHILNHSLRAVFKTDVTQKGSLVDDEKLRFDFSHADAPSMKDLTEIQSRSNGYITGDHTIYSKEVNLDQAKTIGGVRAVFGETYPNPVRVVSVGIPVTDLLATPDKKQWWDISVEFCGGTHVSSTSEIRKLVVVESSAIAKGVRRIVAFTGNAAEKVLVEAQQFSAQLIAIKALPVDQTQEPIKAAQLAFDQLTISVVTKTELKGTLDTLVAALNAHKKELTNALKVSVLKQIKDHFTENPDASYFILKAQSPATSQKLISEAVNMVKKSYKTKSLYLVAASEDVIVHGVYVGTTHLTKKVDAAAWSIPVAAAVGGSFGGKDATRSGTGTHPDQLQQGYDAAKKYIMGFE